MIGGFCSSALIPNFGLTAFVRHLLVVCPSFKLLGKGSNPHQSACAQPVLASKARRD